MALDLDSLILDTAMLMNSDEVDQGAEAAATAARLLRALSAENRGDENMRSQLGQNLLLLKGLLHQLRTGSDAARYWSCQCIVSLSHKHAENQSAIAKYPGMMEAIVKVLVHGSGMSRDAACSALVELTLRNAENALLVAKTPGMMHGVVTVMQNSNGDVRDDAAGVLRNCTNYSLEAAEVIVQTPGVLDALIELCKGQHILEAIGTIQNLTRCESVAPLLRKTCVVADALTPALQAAGTGKEHSMLRAEALMAITNLSTPDQLLSVEDLPNTVEVIVQMLRCAVRGQSWKDVAWYDAEECLRPLAQMTVNPNNHAILRSAGLVHVLADLLCYWIEEQACYLPAAVHEEAQYALARVDNHGRVARTSVIEAASPAAWMDSGARIGKVEDSAGVAEEFETCIGIGHERLRNALAVWELATRGNGAGHEGGVTKGGDSEAARQPATSSWSTGDRNQPPNEVPHEVDMASIALVKLASTEACGRTMRRLGLPSVLRAVAAAADDKMPSSQQQSWAPAWVMEPRHIAVCMGQHPVLGSNSYLMQLDAPILWLIIQNASCISAAVRCLGANHLLALRSPISKSAPCQ